MPKKQEVAAKTISKAREYFGKGQHDRALVACARAIKADPDRCEAYDLRWMILGETLAPDEARNTINPEVETFLNTHPETPEVLFTAYWGYMRHPRRTHNVPDHLFDRMLQHPGTDAMLAALLGLAEQSQDPREKWAYNRRIIDEFTASSTSYLSWYYGAYEDLLRLAEQDRTLASDEYLDELIERGLQAHLAYCQQTRQAFFWPYCDWVKYRLTLSIRLDKALETLACAEARLQEKEEQEFLVEHMGSSAEQVQQIIVQLQGQTYLKQERWRKAYRALKVTAPKEFISLSSRFHEHTIEHFWRLGRAAEGLKKWDMATRYYTDAHFAPQPHPEAQAGLKSVFKTQHGSLRGFKAFLRTAESEYRTREDRERQRIRRHLVSEKMDQVVPDFSLESLEGQPFSLSDMRGSVVLFDIWATWCYWCHRAIPELEKVYEHFLAVDEVEVLGVNDGESPEKAEAFLEEHQPPWPIFLDGQRNVSNACAIRGIPCFILIDQDGRWQYKSSGYSDWLAQELIWLIDALLHWREPSDEMRGADSRLGPAN